MIVQPTTVQIGGLALIVGLLALAQRLGGWEHRPLSRVLGLLSSLLFIAWLFYFLPNWVAWVLTVVTGCVVCLFVVKWLRKGKVPAGRDPRIEDFEVANALNIRVTNTSVNTGLGGSALILNRIQKWNSERHEFRTVQGFQRMCLYGDDVGLPLNVPRTFQVLEFIDLSSPVIHGAVNGAKTDWDIEEYGIWKADMELAWSGGKVPFVRYIEWDEPTSPHFRQPPD